MTDVLNSAKDNGANDLLSSLVGDGKKYKTTEDLAKSRIEADSFIEQLKSENAEMRRELEGLSKKVDGSATIQDLMNTIRDLKSSKGNQSENQSETGFTEEELSAKIKTVVDELGRETTQKSNYERSNALVLEHFKNDANAATNHIRSRASELGLTVDTLVNLGKTSPSAFAEMLGIRSNSNQPNPNPTISDRLKGNPPGAESGVRDFAYYEKLRKELGAKYWNVEIQQQKMRDAQALGDKFMEGYRKSKAS